MPVNLFQRRELDAEVKVESLDLMRRGIIAKSSKMREVIKLAWRVAKAGCTALITGESGTGKEVVAQLIHEWSKEFFPGPFIKVNCGAIPATLLESELFGYEKGAFTGANREGKKGKFELAHKGTILLDEIGELPLDLQVKLLRVIQDHEIARLGGEMPQQLNVRVICATNRNLKDLVRQGKFREDLFFRLNIVPINIPPLRERPEDIIPLIALFKKKLEAKYGVERKCSPEVKKVLFDYHWPGNVREVENVLERTYIIGEPTRVITPEQFISYYLQADWERSNNSGEKYISVHRIGFLKDVVKEAEIELIKLAYEKLYTTKRVSSALGIDQSTITRRIRKLGIRRPL